MAWFYLLRKRLVGSPLMRGAALIVPFAAITGALSAQSVPPALESPAAQAPQTGPHGEKIPGMPKFHDPAPYDIDEHTGYKQIFDGKSFTGWDADPSIWRVEDGVMVGETVEGKAKGNNYIVYRGDKTRKGWWRRDSVPECHRSAVDTTAAEGGAAV
jgi:hypothetical protein